MTRRFPDFQIRDLTGNPGTRTMTGDGMAYLGALGMDKQINVAYGLSGYGITLAPSIGKMSAELLTEGRINGEFQATGGIGGVNLAGL